jgi:Lar family restriction alleviation protein
MSIVARPCPFCGGPPVLYSRMDGDPPECAEAYVFCHECGAQGPTVDDFWDVAIDPTQKDMGIAAVIAWNKSDGRNANLYGVAHSTFDESTGLRQGTGET